MAFTANTGEYKAGRSDVFSVDPRALTVDWAKNLSRGGVRPPVDEALMQLGRDMMPKRGDGATEEGTSGQLNPILCRPRADRSLEVVGGFRRMAAALWLIESGECPDFQVKYVVSRMSDAEAALVNLAENINREDPAPMQLAHAIRCLTEDYGLDMKVVAARLKRSADWCRKVVDFVMLPAPIQSAIADGTLAVKAAAQLVRVPADQQIKVFEDLKGGGEKKVTARQVREKRQEVAPQPTDRPVPKTIRDLKGFLELQGGPGSPGNALACHLLNYLAGTLRERDLAAHWAAAFGAPAMKVAE